MLIIIEVFNSSIGFFPFQSIILLLTTQQLIFLTQQAMALTLMAFTNQPGWRGDKRRLCVSLTI